MKPKIKDVPGPIATNLVERDNLYVSPSYTRSYPLVADVAKGMWITDPDGNRFLDFTSGIAVCSTGHCHPKVVKAIKDQAGKLIHMSGTDFYYEPQIKLAEKLHSIAPAKMDSTVFFCNSGAEAIESAFKLSRWHANKRKLSIAFFGSFHGRTMGALSLTASKKIQRARYSPLVPGVCHVPYAYCYRCPYNLSFSECNIECVRWIEDELFRTMVPPEEVAAIFVEPIQGEGGYIMPPIPFHWELRKLADKYGILYVADEIQSGIGRTGEMLAIEHFVGVVPDIITLAKGIASGMPLGAMIAKREVMDWYPGTHASTFGGNPVSCAAALATIELIEKELVLNANLMGGYFLLNLRRLQNEFECIGDVRGIGLMLGIELVKDRETKERASSLRDEIIQKAFKKGLLLLGCGENTIRFCPPLIVKKPEIDTCLNILEEILKNSN